jgi:hypothetical protein
MAERLMGRYLVRSGEPDSDAALAVRLGLSGDLKPESYRLTRADGGVEVLGGDDRGLLYGTGELATQLLSGGVEELRDIGESPRFPFRAVKFNLPWDAYRPGEAMTRHIETCRNPKLWTDLLDMMAENRFNALTIWNLHPFSFMVKAAGFPEAADFSDDELAEWRELWQYIFRAAKNRGIETYIVFWCIFVSRAFADVYDISFPGREYYIGDGNTSQVVKDYNRQIIRQTIDEYEDLTGIGVSLGERMENMSAQEREDWVEEVVIGALREASRPVRFIHRAPFTDDPSPLRNAIRNAGYHEDVIVEYKFNWSHAHSTPKLARTHDVHMDPRSKPKVNDMYWNPKPEGYKMAWMARNEDFFVLRWGDPDFVRDHIRLNGQDYVTGYFVGAEGLIPAKDLSQRPSDQRDWHFFFQKQWLFWKVWGRLLYNPGTPDDVFAQAFEHLYGSGVGHLLLEGYRHASRMPLWLVAFHAPTWDYTMYAEGFLAPFPLRTSFRGIPDQAFLGIDRFIDHPTLEPDWLSIPEFVEDGPQPPKKSPEELAGDLDGNARVIEGVVRELRDLPEVRPAALESEIGDLEAWLALTRYFAAKLRGGIALHRYRTAGDVAQKQKAVAELEAGVVNWKAVIAATDPRYREVPYIWRDRQNYELRFSWKNHLADVEQDLEIARNA